MSKLFWDHLEQVGVQDDGKGRLPRKKKPSSVCAGKKKKSDRGLSRKNCRKREEQVQALRLPAISFPKYFLNCCDIPGIALYAAVQ